MHDTAANKPCDQCTRRKVRCDYESPCSRCQDANLECTHSIVRKKRGPKKGKGAILDRLRSGSQSTESPGASNTESLDHLVSSTEQEIAPLVSRTEYTQGNLAAQPPGTFYQQPALFDTQRSGRFIEPSTTFDQSYGISTATAEPLSADNLLTFDDFTQNVLADSGYFSFEPPLPGATPSFPTETPLASTNHETPGTAFATSLAVPDSPDGFEVTPVVERSLELFSIHLYPTYPLISRERLNGWLRNPHALSRSEQTIIWSICAAVLVMVDSWPDISLEQRFVSSHRFIRMCQRLRIEWDFRENPCFEDILTSLFIANTNFELKCRKASWTYVREAITLATAAGLHDENTYLYLSHEEQLRRRRTFALLFITERGAAILDFLPTSMLLPPELMEIALPNEDPMIAAGLTSLHGLFSFLDFKFVRLWNDPSHLTFGGSSYADLAGLQKHLRELRIRDAGLSEIQRADVLITQQWLRLIFWQAALRQSFISTTADDPAFTYSYPIEIAMDLCRVVKSLPPIAIQVHGLGIFEKQFEVAYSLMDTLALSGSSQPEHNECLRYLLLSLSASPSSRQVYVKTLEKKMDRQQKQKYRSLAGVQLLRDDGGSRQASRRQSTAFGRRTNQSAA